MTCAKEAAQQVLQDDELRNDPQLMQKVPVPYRLDGVYLVLLICTKGSPKSSIIASRYRSWWDMVYGSDASAALLFGHTHIPQIYELEWSLHSLFSAL